MKPVLALTIAAAIATPAFVAPQVAAADSCRRSANTGTVVGGLGGAALGNAVAGHGAKTEGTILGGVVGAVAGHQIAKHNSSNCDNYRPPRQCKWTSEYRHGRKHKYEVCKGRDGVWRRS